MTLCFRYNTTHSHISSKRANRIVVVGVVVVQASSRVEVTH
nr:MAG TPA: hypothetical protein [Caudoviricetes sp.]